MNVKKFDSKKEFMDFCTEVSERTSDKWEVIVFTEGGKKMLKEYKNGNVIMKINSEGLYVAYCKNCNNQLNYIDYGGYDYCQSKNFNCKNCNSPCTGLKEQYETGYYEKTVHGYCKKCNTKIEY